MRTAIEKFNSNRNVEINANASNSTGTNVHASINIVPTCNDMNTDANFYTEINFHMCGYTIGAFFFGLVSLIFCL